MTIENDVKVGMVCRHHSGRVYTVLGIANERIRQTSRVSLKFPVTVIYMGANGNIWTRDLCEFLEKFTILYDGTNLAEVVEREPKSIRELWRLIQEASKKAISHEH